MERRSQSWSFLIALGVDEMSEVVAGSILVDLLVEIGRVSLVSLGIAAARFRVLR